MSYDNTPPSRHQVNWDDPELRSLLQKTESWALDNRGVFSPVACDIYVGWGAGTGKPGTLVFERESAMVIEAGFAIPQGENLRVDYLQAGVRRSKWGVVAEARPGRRAGDQANGIHVYWVHMR